MKRHHATVKSILAAAAFLAGLIVLQPGARANEPYQCVTEEVTDALECGTSWVVSGAQCGWEYVTSAARCGTQVVTDAARCGTTLVTSGAQCGWDTVTSAAQCGWETVTSAARCGWDQLTCLFGLLCKPKTCRIEATCQIPRSCQQPKTCTVPLSCHAPKGCEMPNTCDVEVCVQDQPGGECIPGLVPCEIEGFACDPVFMACMPSYEPNLAVQERQACEALYSPALEAAAAVAGLTTSFGVGAGGAIGLSASAEVGTVYGPNGEFGCYRTICGGVVSDVNIAAWVAFGQYENWSSFAGNSYVVAVGGSIPEIEIGGTAAAIFDTDGNPIGMAETVSVGVGLLPAQAGLSTCNTVVYQVY